MGVWRTLLKCLRGGHTCCDCGIVTPEHNAIVRGSVNGVEMQFHNIHSENLCAGCTLRRVTKSFNEGLNVSNQVCKYYPTETRTVHRVGSIVHLNQPGKICVLLGSQRWGDAFTSERAIATLLQSKR